MDNRIDKGIKAEVTWQQQQKQQQKTKQNKKR